MIPRIMDDSQPIYRLVEDTACLGYLPETVSCIVHEARNGEYTATMVVPYNARHIDLLHEGGIIKLKANETSKSLQLFRINGMSKSLSGNNVTLSLEHISYDLKKVAVLPFTATGIKNVLVEMHRHIAGGTPFVIDTDIDNTTSVVKTTIPVNYRELLGGMEGSILDIFSGPGGYCEFEFDNLTTHVYRHRGADNGVVIAYGKNLIDVTHDVDMSTVYSHIIGYCTRSEGNAVCSRLTYVTPAEIPATLIVDLTDKLNDGETPTVSRVNALVADYVNNNDITAPQITITVSMQALRNTDQYEAFKELETVALCDYVTLKVASMGINTLVEVIELDYDVLNEEVSGVTLGNYMKSLATTIANIGRK